MDTLLITGANRGVGYEMTRQALEQGHVVVAACRQPDAADALQALAQERLHIVALDVSDEASVAAAAAQVGSMVDHIDVLVNNAGVLVVRGESAETIDLDVMTRTLVVNTVGPMRVIKHFLPLLRKGSNRRIVNTSSQLGSLARLADRSGGEYSYNASKAGLNMLTRMLSHNLASDEIAVISIHPGWVQTDMGGKAAAVTPSDSAAGILKVLDSLTMAESNRFYIYDGTQHEW